MEGGFWWGFFLWIIGVIIVAVRPNDARSQDDYSSHIFYCPNCRKVFSGVSSSSSEKCYSCNSTLVETTILSDVWRSYTEYTKEEMKRAFANGQYLRNGNAATRSAPSPSPVSGADEIKKYKEI